jgi:hypothetical protein
MTSANVIEYSIFNKDGDEVGRHRHNIMCRRDNDGLEKFKPASDFTILSWGYDEEEEYWEGEKQNLTVWLSENKAEITSKEFSTGDIVDVRKIGKCEIIQHFGIFKKEKNLFPVYDVKTETGEIITINQNDIKPQSQIENI